MPQQRVANGRAGKGDDCGPAPNGNIVRQFKLHPAKTQWIARAAPRMGVALIGNERNTEHLRDVHRKKRVIRAGINKCLITIPMTPIGANDPNPDERPPTHLGARGQGRRRRLGRVQQDGLVGNRIIPATRRLR